MKARFALATMSLFQLACGLPARAQDRDDNLTWLRSAADAGDLRGLFALGNRFLHGQGVDRDYAQALAYFRGAADQSFAPAQNQLGIMYERGLGVPKDYLGAMNYYRQAADQGYALAQYNVGRLYDSGLGTRIDHQRAFDWFRKAADQSLPDAQDAVGFYYQRGVAGPQVFDWAMDWYQKAASQGCGQALNDIGHLYQTGLGVQKDYEQALSWYYKAAEAGNSDGQVNIGYMYEHGSGLESDFAQAMMWYRRSASQGNIVAANNVGYMYDRGEGVPTDYGRALAWYQVAANQGHKTAIENIELLRKKLEPSDPGQWEAANRYARQLAQELTERITRNKNSTWEAAQLELDARQEESLAAQMQQRNAAWARGVTPVYPIDAQRFRAEAQKFRFQAADLRKGLTEIDEQQSAGVPPRTAPSTYSSAISGADQANDRSAEAAGSDDDPPSRVAQLRYVRGRVSFEPAGTDDWFPPTVNRPMTTGDKLWVDEGARAELGTDSAKIRLNSTTGLSFLNLNDHMTQIRLTEGSIQIHLRRLDDDESFEVDTPNLALSLLRPGNFRLDVNEAGDITSVTVRGGQGEVTAGGAAFAVRAGQAGTFAGIDQISQDIEPIQGGDDFDDWCRNQDRREEHAQSARYVSRDVIGYEDLDDNGEWRHVPQYGDVWVPTAVPVGWAPYHNGHWAWVSPWGWTWVDDMPWGFAPFHYGRWAYVNGYWAWCPGPIATAENIAPARPVYAPALVAWVGSARLGPGSEGGVAWFPLGPREVYVPPYHVSQAYVTHVNVTNTTVTNTYVTNVYNNTTNITNVNVTNVTYVNKTAPGAVTAVPQSAFTSAQPVAKAAVQVDARQIAVARVATNTVGVAPQTKSVVGTIAPTANVPKPPDSAVNRPVVAKVTPPPPPVSFAVQQQMIQQNGGRPVSPAEIQRMQVQQHIPPAATPVQVKIAPPVAAAPGASQAAGNSGQQRQNDTNQDQRGQGGHSERENPAKGITTALPIEQAKPAPPNGPVRDMRVPLPPPVNQQEHTNQPQMTNVTNKSEIKANPQPQNHPAVLQKNEARKDQATPMQASASTPKSQSPTAEERSGDANSHDAPIANDKVKANPQTQAQPVVPQENDARKDQSIPAPAPISKAQPSAAETKPADNKPSNAAPQNMAPLVTNNPANRAPAKAGHDDQHKQPEAKGQQQKNQQSQQQKADKKQSDKPGQPH